MTQFRSPIIWRLILWFLLLFLIPIGIVLAFVQNQVRSAYITSQIEDVQSRARLISEIVSAQPGNEQAILARMASVEDGPVFILKPDGTYLVHSDPAKNGKAVSDDLGVQVSSELLSRGNTGIDDTANGRYIGASRNPANGTILVVVKKSAAGVKLLAQLSNSILAQLIAALAISMLVGIAVILTILSPLSNLARFADQISGGDLNAEMQTGKLDGELAILANSLKSLAVNVRNSIATLEDRVQERTQTLERRALQLQAAADVSKVITSIRDTRQILEETTHLISQRFGYYHAGIFLLDEFGEYAVLTAANSEGGKRMLERGHRLKVGETGLVGFVTRTGQPRIALDVGQDAVYFDNPDLPDTHSEIAVPIMAGGEILGALDVQSTEPGAFTESDAATLQVLAEQLAVTIQNARLFEQTQTALDAARRAYTETSRDAWQKLLSAEEQIGFIATQGSLRQASQAWSADLIKAVESGDAYINEQEQVVSLPVKIRGQVIGAIRLRKPENSGAWTKEETSLAMAFTEQLSGALESARLYREAQQRATREAIVSDISSRITTSPRMENVLRDTITELGQAMGNVSVSFQLLRAPDEEDQLQGPNGGGNGHHGKSSGEEEVR